MKFVNDLLNAKGHDVFSVGPEVMVFDALEMMAEKNCGALVVLEEARIVGIFSERDYARKIILHGRRSRRTSVQEIMTEIVATVAPGDSVRHCMEVMTHKRIRHLPVVDGDEIVGVVSIGDVVASIISDQEFMIGQLENYITGKV